MSEPASSSDRIRTVADLDPWLKPYRHRLVERQRYLDYHEERILGDRSVSTFALGHLYYGLHRTKRDWVLREWAPNASQIYLICQATNWRDDPAYRLERLLGSDGDWEIKLPLDALHHLDHYRLHIHWLGGSGDRLPSYANYVVQDPSTKQFDAVVWQPKKPFVWRHRVELPVPDEALIYEAHIGMAGDREAVSTYRQFERDVLPRVKDLGYNTVQLMAIAEHPYYGSFGYQVSNFFAPSSRFGTPGELKHLIDRAHQLGIRVIMDLIHSHAVKNEAEGLSNFDGTTTQYFVDEIHPAWDSRLFDYGKPQVCHFLLSNISYWLNEYHLDGFRFDGVTSMIYRDHGLGRAFTGYDDYFGDNINQDALVYLRLANELVHTIKPNATTIAEDTSGLPGLAAKVVDGGIGFDYRFNMGVPDLWIKMLKDQQDEEWDMGKLFHELTSHRAEERTINYVESHDQAMVGDKTVIFRLLDDTMYDSMERSSQSLVVDRGIALHKMIRLITASTNAGGYLNFMGNEFGHPEWIDFPRPGNEWSYRYARRQWHLVDDLRLRYSQLNDFDRAMIREIKGLVGVDYSHIRIDSERQLISFARGGRLFVFNFSSVSLTDWRVSAPKKDWQIVLSTDDPSYGGFGRVDTSMIYLGSGNSRDSYVQLYLPARVALVLEPKYRDLAASPWR